MRRLAGLARDLQLLLSEAADGLEAALRFGHVGKFQVRLRDVGLL